MISWFADEAAELLGDLRESRARERRERLRELLNGAGGGEMTLRDLERRHSFTRAEVETILAKIGGRIEKKSTGRGRPALIARLAKSAAP